MNTPNDGGPAFPCHTNPLPGKLANAPQGMTMRDWFAGSEGLREYNSPEVEVPKKMMESLAGEEQPENGWGGDLIAMLRFDAKWRAALKYIRADAMLAARDRKDTP